MNYSIMTLQNFRYIFILLILTLWLIPQKADAQTIIRDSEIESYLSQWFAPIFESNGMSPDQVNIILVQDNEVNAFVAGGSNIFIYTGLIKKTDERVLTPQAF